MQVQNNALVFGTDCSGLGSVEEATKRLRVNHKIAFACERDKYAKASYLANHSPEYFYDDITTRDNSQAPGCDVYVAGFPCQAFSIAGKQKGFEDSRGTIFFNCLEYIDLHKPRLFILENVKGLLSHDKQKGSKSKYGRTFGVIRDALAITINGQRNLYKYDDCVNYHVHFQVLNTKNYGIPQNRERIFMVGFRDESDSVKFNMPSKIPLEIRLKHLLDAQVDEKYYLSETAINRLIKRKNFIPQINPQITGTINTKNNSGQLSFDNGTTLIVTNNHGQLQQQDVFNCIDANYQKGMDNHGQRSLIMETVTEPNVLTEVRTEYGKQIRKDYDKGVIKEKRKNFKRKIRLRLRLIF